MIISIYFLNIFSALLILLILIIEKKKSIIIAIEVGLQLEANVYFDCFFEMLKILLC